MSQKIFLTEKIDWLLIDLIIVLVYKDKGWTPSYLLVKWTKLPKKSE